MMQKFLQLSFALILIVVVVGAPAADTESEFANDENRYNSTIHCDGIQKVSYDCVPRICTFLYPTIKHQVWESIPCCGACTPKQCCSAERWDITIPLLTTWLTIMLGFFYITRPYSRFWDSWLNYAKAVSEKASETERDHNNDDAGHANR